MQMGENLLHLLIVLTVAMPIDVSCMQFKSVGLRIDSNCTNVNLSHLEEIYSFRVGLYDASVSTHLAASAVSTVIPVSSHRIHYCAWMNDRILDNCSSNQTMDYVHRDTLNEICGPTPRGPPCHPQLCNSTI